MQNVRGAGERVLEAEASKHELPEGLRILPEARGWRRRPAGGGARLAEVRGWGSFYDTRPASHKELTFVNTVPSGFACLTRPTTRSSPGCSASRDGATRDLNTLPEEGGSRLNPIPAVLSLCLQLGVNLPLVREVSAMGAGRCACVGEVAEFGYHYMARHCRGMFTYRNDAV
ncbi:hypothetical protein CYMTET_25744 [Cymbomonas tetramitiformis]|uniref:Uncharacterized protein n=1 Tax=Cymbomonas tetramitiformis TaxID=36881 RepID=A0AAE0KYL0_9CHLO|nr:hypothetical protein CYMTET_25744 [Cymbomonas tetramitiformis]